MNGWLPFDCTMAEAGKTAIPLAVWATCTANCRSSDIPCGLLAVQIRTKVPALANATWMSLASGLPLVLSNETLEMDAVQR